MRMETPQSVIRRSPPPLYTAARVGGFDVFASGTRLLQNLEPKRRRKFNPPFKWTQTRELNISRRLKTQTHRPGVCSEY